MTLASTLLSCAAQIRRFVLRKNTSVFGIYTDRMTIEEAVDTLRIDGFRTTDISVLLPDNPGSRDFTHQKNTKAPEGAAAGMGAGAMLGGAIGLLAGIGALAVPGFGSFIAVGPIIGALAGAAAVGTVGGVAGGLIGLGMPEYEAKRYEGIVKKGGILLSVHSDNSDWTARAKKILEQTGAEDISSTGETKGDMLNTDRPLPRETTM